MKVLLGESLSALLAMHIYTKDHLSKQNAGDVEFK